MNDRGTGTMNAKGATVVWAPVGVIYLFICVLSNLFYLFLLDSMNARLGGTTNDGDGVQLIVYAPAASF